MFSGESITVIVFYSAIILLIAYFRKNFEFHGWIKFLGLKFPLVAQLKTKLGLKLMKNIGEGHSTAVKRIAYVGIYFSYVIMVGVIAMVAYGVYQLFVNTGNAVFTPVLPGVQIPGSPIPFPFWHTLIALFITVVIHEFSHGVVSRAHKVPVESSGYAQVGPISAAFVEPNEKKLEKISPKAQNAIFAAGPWSNFLTAGIIALLFIFVFGPIASSFYGGSTLTFQAIEHGSPAEIAGLKPGVEYSRANNISNLSISNLIIALDGLKPGDSFIMEAINGSQSNVVLGHNQHDQACIGIQGIDTVVKPTIPKFWHNIYLWFLGLLNWIIMLSIGLGMGNLIPAGPVDGGRMYLLACQKFFGKKKGEKVWSRTAIVLFAILILLIIVPIIFNIFNKVEIISCIPL